MTGRLGNRRRNFLVPAAITAALLAGCADAPETAPPPQQPLPSVSPAPAESPAAPNGPLAVTPPDVLPASRPVSLDIPSTGTTTELLSLGLLDDGTLDVPPGDPGAPAGWYNLSPTPGERGPAVLLGHVNATDGGPGVFAGLRDLGAGDTVTVTREDGTTATFEFQRGESYAKDSFPTQTVYGNTAGAELRLITCDGFDPDTGQFDDNYVVYATLTTQ